jgi:hypothetical protein
MAVLSSGPIENNAIFLQEEDYRCADSIEAEKEGRAMSVSELMRNPFL